ncbi:MAG: hypothetical protein LBT04_09290 [Prevotellaceae bacterium]|jgi:hypothetical protein|nr:hypothetical protein [Prevotellaceae bacterium]
MIIAVDFDGTIVEEAYPAIGKPVPFAIEVLKRLQEEEHHQLVLWTVREGKLLEDAVQYCRGRGIEFYAINSLFPGEVDFEISRKIAADVFIDDRSIGGLPDWGLIYRMITKNETWETIFAMQNELPKGKKGFFKKLFT